MVRGVVGDSLPHDGLRNSVSFTQDEVLLPGRGVRFFANLKFWAGGRHTTGSGMAHYRRAVGTAVALNTAIFVVEGIAGYQAGSLALVMDSVHNLSDELAL